MIPRYYEDEEIEARIIEQEWFTEDDAMQREQDIRDHYEDENNPDDLADINIG